MSASFVREILPWLAPPVVGAAVGLVMGDIAQRLIVRPLLKKSITNLITPGTLHDLIHSEKASASLASGISSATGALLDRSISGLTDAGTAALGKTIPVLVLDAVRKLLGSRAFIYGTREVVGRLVESLSSRKLHAILGGPGLRTLVTGTIFPMLAEEKKRDSIARSLASLLTSNVGRILDDRFLDELATSLEPYAPQVADRIVAWLKSSETRSYLSDKGRELLPRILEKLNVMQRFLLSAGQFDKRLTEKMPEIVDETIATLESIARDQTQQRRVLRLLVDIARDMRDGLSKEQAGQGLSGAFEHMVGRFLQGLGNPETAQGLWDGIQEKILSGDPTIGAFARQSFGMRTEEIAETLSRKILELATKPETAAMVAAYIVERTEGYLREKGGVPLKDILHVDAARKEKLDAFLLAKLVQKIDQSVPEIQAAIDLENRLMPAVATRLTWMDLFGAVLGLVVGLFQLLLRLAGIS